MAELALVVPAQAEQPIKGYPAGVVRAVTGVTSRELDYWTTTGLVAASARESRGTGEHRRYAVEDVVRVAAVRWLRKSGMSLQGVRKLLAGMEPGAATVEQRRGALTTCLDIQPVRDEVLLRLSGCRGVG